MAACLAQFQPVAGSKTVDDLAMPTQRQLDAFYAGLTLQDQRLLPSQAYNATHFANPHISAPSARNSWMADMGGAFTVGGGRPGTHVFGNADGRAVPDYSVSGAGGSSYAGKGGGYDPRADMPAPGAREVMGWEDFRPSENVVDRNQQGWFGNLVDWGMDGIIDTIRTDPGAVNFHNNTNYDNIRAELPPGYASAYSATVDPMQFNAPTNFFESYIASRLAGEQPPSDPSLSSLPGLGGGYDKWADGGVVR